MEFADLKQQLGFDNPFPINTLEPGIYMVFSEEGEYESVVLNVKNVTSIQYADNLTIIHATDGEQGEFCLDKWGHRAISFFEVK
jgi:hypothetical protein